MSFEQWDIIQVGELTICPSDRILKRNGVVVPMAPKAFNVMLLLVERAGMLVDRELLRKHIWGDLYVEDATLARVIADVRKALGDVQEQRRYIETVPKFGYRWIAPIERCSPQRDVPEEVKTPVEGRRHWRFQFLLSALALACLAVPVVFELHHKEETRLERPLTRDAEAERYYQLGRYYWNRRDPLSSEMFQRAIDRDPRFAAAYAGMANTILLRRSGEGIPGNRFALAKPVLEKAVALDPKLGEPHATLGLIAESFDLDWEGADREFRTAIRLAPRYATAHHWYAEFLTMTGRFDLAEAEFQAARQIDPSSPIIVTDLAQLYNFRRDYQGSLKVLDEALQLDHDFKLAHERKGYALMLMRRPAEAVIEFDAASRLAEHPTPVELRAWAASVKGQKERAMALVSEAEAESKDALLLAVIWGELGDMDRAMDWIEKGYAERAAGVVSMPVNPLFDRLRGCPRFRALMAKMHAGAS